MRERRRNRGTFTRSIRKAKTTAPPSAPRTNQKGRGAIAIAALHVRAPDFDAYTQSAAGQADDAKAQIAKLRHDYTAAVVGIARLLEMAEKGLSEGQGPTMRERLVALKLQRDQIAKEIGELQSRMASLAPTIASEKVARVGGRLRDKLYAGPDLRSSGRPTRGCSLRKSGSPTRKSASAARNPSWRNAPRMGSPSFVQEWRARRDSNSRPPDS